jgi:hypothetical protein
MQEHGRQRKSDTYEFCGKCNELLNSRLSSRHRTTPRVAFEPFVGSYRLLLSLACLQLIRKQNNGISVNWGAKRANGSLHVNESDVKGQEPIIIL